LPAVVAWGEGSTVDFAGRTGRSRKTVALVDQSVGDDYYIEIQRHRGLENIDGSGVSQEDINQTLLGFAKKYNRKVIATNDSHYVNEDDWLPHDILLVSTRARTSKKAALNFPVPTFSSKPKRK